MKELIMPVLTSFAMLSTSKADVYSKTSDTVVLHLGALGTQQEKIAYLLDEAREFIKNDKYKDAIAVTNYVTQRLDANSVEARDLNNKAEKELKRKNIGR